MKKFSFKPILFMIVISVIYTGALASINEFTKDRVRLNAQIKEKAAFLYILNFDLSGKGPQEINSLYDQYVQKIEKNSIVYYEAYLNKEERVLILPMEENAAWGPIRGIIVITPDFERIVGIDFLSHNETPGLGGRIDEASFKNQFRNLEINPEIQEDYILYRPAPGGQVDAISGATLTSNSVRRGLNNTIREFISQLKGV